MTQVTVLADPSLRRYDAWWPVVVPAPLDGALVEQVLVEHDLVEQNLRCELAGQPGQQRNHQRRQQGSVHSAGE